MTGYRGIYPIVLFVFSFSIFVLSESMMFCFLFVFIKKKITMKPVDVRIIGVCHTKYYAEGILLLNSPFFKFSAEDLLMNFK